MSEVPWQDPPYLSTNVAIWQAAIDDALTGGSLRLEPTAHPDFCDLVGACPRCGHPLRQTLEFRVVRGATVGVEERVGRFNVDCGCNEPHEADRQAGSVAVGADRCRSRFARRRDADEVQFWKQQVLTRNRDQLATVSRAATAWSALFTAVIGVFGTVAFWPGWPRRVGVDDRRQHVGRPAQLGEDPGVTAYQRLRLAKRVGAGPAPCCCSPR